MKAGLVVFLWLLTGLGYYYIKSDYCHDDARNRPLFDNKISSENSLGEQGGIIATLDTTEVTSGTDPAQDSISTNTADTSITAISDEATITSSNSRVIRGDKKTVIYFDYNIADRSLDSDISNYLDEVVRNSQKDLSKVYVTGHTDNAGDELSNRKMGFMRARVIKEALIRKGLSPHRILTFSQGEKKPVDSNETEQGRRNNRRTELVIVK